MAILASIEGLNPQLQGHIGIGMYNGLTAEQMRATVELLGQKLGKSYGDNMNQVLKRALNQ